MSDNLTMTSGQPATPGHGGDLRWVTIMQRIRTEYEEMPGLAVTVPQASRLWNIDTATAREVLDAMVDVGYLSAGPRGFTLRSFDRDGRLRSTPARR